MRIFTKRIQVIGLTPQELAAFKEMISEAERGTVVHYAERDMGHGTFLGVSVSDANRNVEPKPRAYPGDMKSPSR